MAVKQSNRYSNTQNPQPKKPEKVLEHDDGPGNLYGVYQTRRQRNEILRSILTNDRSTFLTLWRDLNDFILPRRGRFQISDVNRGDRRNLKIYDSTATLAARTLRSGMMSGVTSPARPWFRLGTPDPDLAEFGPVKDWLYTVTQRMLSVFSRSNLYNILPIIYGDMGVFATSAMFFKEIFTNELVSFQALPIGSYYIATNDRRKVDVFVRDFRMTIRQVVNEFADKDQFGMIKYPIDWYKFSRMVKYYWDLNQLDVWIDVTHIIDPNPNWDANKPDNMHMKYSSVYYERGTAASGTNTLQFEYEDIYLYEGGFNYFPVLCPRWEVTGEDVYGTDCPGITSLGDIKGLQIMQKRKAQAIEKMVNPPMTGPSSLKNSKASILPGDITYVDATSEKAGFRPAHEVNPRVQEILQDIGSHQERIKKGFFEDLFLMMIDSDRREITATEIAERREEKLLALGPVLEQLNQDLLDPLIDATFRIMMRRGLVPKPPQELQGTNYDVEYVSVMAQAQKAVGLAGLDRFTQFTGQTMQMNPQAGDKVNFDSLLDHYGDATSVPPGILVPDDQVQAIRQQRAQQQAAAQKLAALQQGSETAKNLSQSDTSGQNALTDLINQGNAGNVAPALGG